MRKLAAMALSIAVLAANPIRAQDDERDGPDFVADRIHADLPLYTFEWEDLWPRNFYQEDTFGCLSRVGFGDWRVTLADADEDEPPAWDRYTNYGVFHCAALMTSADNRADLDDADWKYGFFVKLGEGRSGSDTWELWALQQGIAPGSDYILLARAPATQQLVEKFDLLQQRCPRANRREAKGFDVWSSGYCAINSRAELLSLARRMVRLPHRGTLERVPDPPEGEAPASADAPSN